MSKRSKVFSLYEHLSISADIYGGIHACKSSHKYVIMTYYSYYGQQGGASFKGEFFLPTVSKGLLIGGHSKANAFNRNGALSPFLFSKRNVFRQKCLKKQSSFTQDGENAVVPSGRPTGLQCGYRSCNQKCTCASTPVLKKQRFHVALV